MRRHLLDGRLAVRRGVADVVGAGTDDAREALAQAVDDRARLVDRQRRLRDVGELLGIGDLERVDVGLGLHEHDVLGGLAHRALDLLVAVVADEDDGVALGGELERLAVDLGHQRAGGVDRAQPAAVGLGVDRRRHAVGAEDGHRALGDRVVELLDEDRPALAQLLDDVLVVHDLLAHVHRRAVELERVLDRLHGPVDARAIAARGGQEQLLGGGGHAPMVGPATLKRPERRPIAREEVRPLSLSAFVLSIALLLLSLGVAVNEPQPSPRCGAACDGRRGRHARLDPGRLDGPRADHHADHGPQRGLPGLLPGARQPRVEAAPRLQVRRRRQRRARLPGEPVPQPDRRAVLHRPQRVGERPGRARQARPGLGPLARRGGQPVLRPDLRPAPRAGLPVPALRVARHARLGHRQRHPDPAGRVSGARWRSSTTSCRSRASGASCAPTTTITPSTSSTPAPAT